ncbi:MAG: ISNCY family transposase, partial [Acidobacteria bacterium]|nr:ISNCY family transposase [Acidobacteriota bacterium]
MERLEMSQKERRRLEVLSRVKRGALSLVKAAELLHLSYRQAKRVYRRYCRQGDRGLVHRLRGRPSNRGTDEALRRKVLQRYRDTYVDFGPTLACEYLAKDGLKVSVETLRLWLLKAGLWVKQRQRSAHRSWRPRKEHCGEMVQMDGSPHDWFEGRRERAVLMVAIDDATNRTYARFFEEETTAAAFVTFQRYVELYGLPRALYVDKDSIYRPGRDKTVDEELAEEPAPTQFGRAMAKLGIELICAHSPQAKGRVERRHGVFQDRLVKALRLEGLSDLDGANAYLEKSFLAELNARFTVAATQSSDLHRRVPAGLELAGVLVFEEKRVVQNDWTVRWRNRWFQLTAANGRLALAGKRVLVREQLDGTIGLHYRGRDLAWRELPGRPEPAPKQTTTTK